MVRLRTVLDSWRSVREDTARAVEDMPEPELDFRPVPEVDSFRQIALHILNAGHGLTGLMLDGVEDFTTPDFRPSLQKHFPALAGDIPAAALALELRSRLEERLAVLAGKSPEFYAKIVTRFDGQQVTNLEMLESLKDHELTHRAQLFVYLRLRGIVPATTRRRQARK